MDKLADLKEKICAPLGLDPSKVFVWADGGSLCFYQGTDDSFLLDYKANLTLSDFGGNPAHLFWLVSKWVKRHMPNASEGSIKFDYELLSSDRKNIYITVPVRDVIKITTDDVETHFNSLDTGRELPKPVAILKQVSPRDA